MAKRNTRRKSGGRAPRRPASRPRALSAKRVTNVVTRVLNRKLETKYKYDYSGLAFPGTGNSYPATIEGHNGSISNLTDIQRLIPPIESETDGALTVHQRIGQKIDVQNLTLHLRVSIKDDALQPSPRALNLMVVVFIWQHKQFKSYKLLETGNNFAQFLDRGDGETGSFSARPCDSTLPLAKDHYKLCKRITFPLRTDGTANGSVVGGNPYVSNSNAAPFSKVMTMNLTKFIPKRLQYPVQETSPAPAPAVDSYPTNSSLCMSVGFYNMNLLYDDVLAEPLINIDWNTKITFKDA